MNLVDMLAAAAGLALIVFLLWFFFGPKTGKAAVFQAGVQEATIRVEGAYQPNRITLKAGVPARLKFDRREATDCSNRVVIPDFDISRALPAFQTTTIEFTPQEPATLARVITRATPTPSARRAASNGSISSRSVISSSEPWGIKSMVRKETATRLSSEDSCAI